MTEDQAENAILDVCYLIRVTLRTARWKLRRETMKWFERCGMGWSKRSPLHDHMYSIPFVAKIQLKPLRSLTIERHDKLIDR